MTLTWKIVIGGSLVSLVCVLIKRKKQKNVDSSQQTEHDEVYTNIDAYTNMDTSTSDSEESCGVCCSKFIESTDCMLQKQFEQTCACYIEYDKPVLRFNMNFKIIQCIKDLSEQDCSCAIVEKAGKVVGVIDTIDIVNFLMCYEGLDLCKTLKQCVRKMVIVYNTSNLMEVAKYLRCGFRYIIVSNSNKDYSIISQGSMLRYIFSNRDFLEQDSVFKESLRNLRICSEKKLVTISCNECVTDAFNLMLKMDITSIPLVDSTGKCVSVMSMSDIKCVASIDLIEIDSVLKISCLNFVKFAREQLNKHSFSHIISCSMDESLENVMQTMTDYDIHHIYILDEGVAVNVVSYVDIIKTLF